VFSFLESIALELQNSLDLTMTIEAFLVGYGQFGQGNYSQYQACCLEHQPKGGKQQFLPCNGSGGGKHNFVVLLRYGPQMGPPPSALELALERGRLGRSFGSSGNGTHQQEGNVIRL
jgi:hypothetical protein